MKPVSPQLLQKLNESLQTKGNNANPTMMTVVSRAKNSVQDADYWVVETIREMEGLGDVAVTPRRLHKNYGGPDRLYEIHVDNGIVKTAIREYPDKLKQGWKEQFSLGAGTDVAIAFDGDWELYRKTWRLRTHEVPWIFWVDGVGVLWGQLWDDDTTKVLLASGVSKVTAIRGWKELNQGLNDQGLVVAYVKIGGTVAYRNYCIQSDLTYIWEVERQITGFTGTATDVGLFLTNDYRLGVLVGNTLGDVWWLITGRIWVGMSIQTENISASVTDLSFDVIPIQYFETIENENINTNITDLDFNVCPSSFELTNVVISQAKIINSNQIKLTFSHEITNIEGSVSNFSIPAKTISTISYGNNQKEIVITVNEVLPSVGSVDVSYISGVLKVFVTSICKPPLNNFNVVATGEPPVINENLRVSIMDLVFEPLLIDYKIINSNIENLTIAITDLVFSITKVGNNPL